MNEKLISETLILLSTMDGWPALLLPAEGEAMGAVAMSYVPLLMRIPDDVGRKVRDGLLMQFGKRPSVKALGEWAGGFAQAKPDAPGYLSLSTANAGGEDLLGGRTPEQFRQGGPQRPSSAGLAVLTDAARETKRQGGTIPPVMRDAVAWLREREERGPAPTVAREDAGEWGLEYVNPDGTSEKHPARYSEAAARSKADDVRREYSHLTVRVWRKGAVLTGGAK